MAAWAITLALPVLDSGNAAGPRIVVSSLGGHPFDLTEAQPAFLLGWAGALGCAASVWFFRSLTWWSVVAMVVAMLLAAMLMAMLVDPPSLLWDGADAQGRQIGGYVVGKPSAGALAWAVGIGALFTAGVCGLIGRTRRKTG